MSLGISSTSDVIPLNQNWHHLYSASVRGKHLSNDWPSGARDMHKNAQKVECKLRAKFPATTPGCSIVIIARLDDASLEVL